MIYVVYEFNSRSEKLRFVTCSSFHSIAFDKAQNLNKKNKKVYLNYYVSPLGKSEFEDAVNKHLLKYCQVVAQCLHLADIYSLMNGKRTKLRAHSFFQLAKEHCKQASLYFEKL